MRALRLSHATSSSSPRTVPRGGALFLLLLWASLAACASLRTGSPAQPAAASLSAEQVAREYFRAVDEQRWNDAARLLDSSTVDRYRADRLRFLVARAEPRRPTAEDLMRSNPMMPREVAEWQVRQMQSPLERESLESYFAHVRTPDELIAMPIEEVGARMLEAADPTYALRLDLERRGCQVPSNALLRVARPGRRVSVVGAVVSDTVAYAVFEDSDRIGRGTMPFDLPARPQILTLRRAAQGWRIVQPIQAITVRGVVGDGCPAMLTPPGTPGRP